MSAIAQRDWLQYLRPAFGSRPTVHVSMPPPAVGVPSRAAREPNLIGLHLQLDRLATLPDGWDGHGSVKPSQGAIERARQLLEDAFRSTGAGTWQSPFISANEGGEVVFEWWNGERNLTIFAGADKATYLRSWGSNIIDEMEDGDLPQTWDPAHWVWLFS